MIKNTLKTLDKNKLRRGLLLFFITLLIPTSLLVQQSYSRLKWETFHQHQRMAVELSSRIDTRLGLLLEKENERPFTDYAFLNIAGDASAGFLQRSPLSEFPLQSEIPGLMGYFQVDSDGQLNTPLVPEDQSQSEANRYGINTSELRQRVELQNKIQDILAENRLIQKSAVPKPQIAFDELKNAPIALSSKSTMSLSRSRSLGKVEDLKLQQTYQKESVVAKDSPIQEKSAKKQVSKSFSKSDTSSADKQPRFEQNILPESLDMMADSSLSIEETVSTGISAEAEAVAELGDALPEIILPEIRKLRIKTFESEIDPFEFSLLDSGHFVLFRKVWLNDKRYTQGLLIEQNAFLDASIKQDFSSTGLSQMSNLLVAYQSDVLTAFSGASNSGYLTDRRELMGEQLYQTRLSAPLSDMQLIYSIIQLPMGAGSQVIVWLGVILGAVLFGGFYLMYRLGISQINLLNQQQNFVSSVSHELKTPLTSIRMYGEMLREGWATEEKKRTYYDFIFDESERLSRLINNVLQLARMTRNEQQAELRECDVSGLLRDIQSKIGSQLERANYSLALDCDEAAKASMIKVDTDWLTQIMINLVDNAIKFSANAEIKTVELSCHLSAKNKLNMTIRDFGPGIDKRQMKQIFKLFYRTENELTRETTGTGIGLSLVQQMATNMGGTVSVENRNPGAAFSVTFPVIR